MTAGSGWLLERFRLGVRFEPETWLHFFAQGQDTRETRGKREKVPFVVGAEGNDPFDLRQAFVDLGNLSDFPLTLKVGRQELAYGNKR